MRIHRQREANFKKEYGIKCQRVYPAAGGYTPFGSSWCRIEPLKRTEPHDHSEGETFFILEGHGLMTIGEEREEVKAGDVVFIPAGETHCLINVSAGRELTFLSVWWNEPLRAAAPLNRTFTEPVAAVQG